MNIISRIYYSFLILSGKKNLIGRRTKIKIFGKDNKTIITTAKVDTGAYTSSIDKSLAIQLGFQDIVDLKESQEFTKFIEKPIDEIKGNIIEIQNQAYNAFKAKFPELSTVKIIISSNGVSIRPELRLRIKFAGSIIETDCNITTRTNLRYNCLLGRKALRKVLIDSSQTN